MSVVNLSLKRNDMKEPKSKNSNTGFTMRELPKDDKAWAKVCLSPQVDNG